MTIPFAKYHGTGNDFIVIDGQLLKGPLSEKLIARMCLRHFGIGADGLIIVSPSADPGVDYAMDYYNADGRVGSMCGNGARCAFHFAQSLGLASTKAVFSAYDGVHKAQAKKGSIAISLQDVTSIQVRKDETYVLNTGSPHYVRFVKDVESIDIYEQGRAVRYSPEFAEQGINVNFAQVTDDVIRVHTYERGVEDITMSCGTGVTAVALAFAMKSALQKGPVTIHTDGGKLAVDFTVDGNTYKSIRLIGPAVCVFESVLDTDRI